MPGLLRGLARTALVAGTATAVSNRVSRRQAGRWAAQDVEEQPVPAPRDGGGGGGAGGGDGGGTDDVLAQLRELGELKSQGVLTEQEFQDQKRRILGS